MHLGVINAFAAHHVIGDVVHRNGFGWNGALRVFQFIKHFHHAVDGAQHRIKLKHNHAQLDYVVGVHTQAGGFGVEHDAALQYLTGGGWMKHLAGHQAPQHFVVGVLVQSHGHVFGAQIGCQRVVHRISHAKQSHLFFRV